MPSTYFELRDRTTGAWYMRAYFDARNYADERRAWFALWESLGSLGQAARAIGHEIAPEIVDSRKGRRLLVLAPNT